MIDSIIVTIISNLFREKSMLTEKLGEKLILMLIIQLFVFLIQKQEK